MSVKLAKKEHEVLYQDLCRLVSKHATAMTAKEILAVASNMVGKLMALQDQRTMTPERAKEIVAKNIEFGNKQVLDELRTKTSGRA